MTIKALILYANGTNRHEDVAHALRLAGAHPEIMPIHTLRESPQRLSNYQMIVVPGGFSYADTLGAGKLLALDLQFYFADALQTFVAAGKPMIGICNGFQALVKSGILPGLPDAEPQATLTFNAQGQFECRLVTLKPTSKTCLWTKDLSELIDCPVAHGEGQFVVRDLKVLQQLHDNDQIALTYVNADGSKAVSYPANPNGSIEAIAGICNPAGNVLGLMPHPEDHVHGWQHPRWTRGFSGRLGLALFEQGVRYASQC